MKLICLRGLPGSGKSTFTRKHFQCCILENDMFQVSDGQYNWSADGTKRAISLCRKLAEEILQNGSDVVICNTFVKKHFIEGYKQLADKYHADLEVIRMTGNFHSIHNVPKTTIDNMKNSFEDWPGEIIQNPSEEPNI